MYEAQKIHYKGTTVDVYRGLIAIRLVKFVCSAIDESYHAYCESDPKREAAANRKFHRRKFLLKLAQKIHKNAAVQQMCEEGWWG